MGRLQVRGVGDADHTMLGVVAKPHREIVEIRKIASSPILNASQAGRALAPRDAVPVRSFGAARADAQRSVLRGTC
jgi:hypothetical protein